MTKTEAVQVNLIYLIFKLVHFQWTLVKNNDSLKYGWEIQAELIIKGFENNTYDQLDSRYIADRAAYNFWKQYEAEWNKKYRSNE